MQDALASTQWSVELIARSRNDSKQTTLSCTVESQPFTNMHLFSTNSRSYCQQEINPKRKLAANPYWSKQILGHTYLSIAPISFLRLVCSRNDGPQYYNRQERKKRSGSIFPRSSDPLLHRLALSLNLHHYYWYTKLIGKRDNARKTILRIQLNNPKGTIYSLIRASLDRFA